MISTQQIKNNYLRQQALAQTARERLNYENQQTLAQEFKELKLIPRCSMLDQDLIRFNLGTIEWTKVAETMHDQFYDAQILQQLACVVDTLVAKYPDQIQGLSFNQLLRNYITQMEKIGEHSQFGLAYDAHLKKGHQLLVIKAPRDMADQNLLHEVFVGLNGLNVLRTKGILNFALIYGGFACAIPITSRSYKVLSWCNHQTPGVNYAIYEYIPTEMSIGSGLRTGKIGLTDLLNYWIQLAYGLQYAERHAGFTHHDLHHGNVLLRQLKTTSYLPLININDNIDGYLRTDQVATIIDYGQAAIRYKNDNYQIKVWSDNYVYAWGDLYKFICYCLYVLQNEEIETGQTSALLNSLAPVFKFFCQEKMREALETQYTYNFVLPYHDDWASKPLYKFVDFLKVQYDQQYDSIFISPSNVAAMTAPILSCQLPGGMECGQNIFPALKVHPTDIWSFYDFIQSGQYANLGQDEQLKLIDKIQLKQGIVNFSMFTGDMIRKIKSNYQKDFVNVRINLSDLATIVDVSDPDNKNNQWQQFYIWFAGYSEIYDTSERIWLRIKVAKVIYQQLIAFDDKYNLAINNHNQWQRQMQLHLLPWLNDSVNYYLAQIPEVRRTTNYVKTKKLFSKVYLRINQYLDQLQLLLGVTPDIIAVNLTYRN